MSLGLSLVAATNHSQLLVSSLGHRRVMGGIVGPEGGWFGVEDDAWEAMLMEVVSAFRPVVQLCRELVRRTCMPKVPASF